jgi:phage/plasmid-associated DNA primase
MRREIGRPHETEKSLPVTTPKKRASGSHGVTRYMKNMVTPRAVPTKKLADAILKSDHFATDGSTLYRFSDGTYAPNGASHVKRCVKALLDEWGQSATWSSYRAKEVVEYLSVDAPSLWLRSRPNVINVKNGVLNLETRQLSPHSPRHLSRVQLPVAYDSQAQCPAWEEFVSQVFPKDARDLAWEMVAHLLVPETSRQQAILLEGEGGNGKSTFLRALIAFLGTENVSTLTLHKLESDRFALARLVGKLANICPDLPSGQLSGTSMFKAITGGDMIAAERKYGLCRKFCSGGHEGVVAPVRVGITRRGHRIVRPP